MGRTQVALVTLALCAGCSGGSAGTDHAASVGAVAPTVLASSASPRGTRVLPGHLSARTRRSSDLGRMDPAARLEGMTLVFPPRGTRLQRERLLAALQDPGSPLYHHWLTPEDYAARFGATEQDVQRVTAWLASQGFEVAGPSRPRTSVRFGGSVDQLERAFRTEMHRYQVRGETHFALAVEPQVPAELADVVAGLRNVHDFHPVPLSRPTPAFVTGASYQLAPADWARIYDVAPLYAQTPALDGTGQKIAVPGAATLLPADILAFRSMFGLSPTTPNTTLVPGTGPGSRGGAGYRQEASLDVEWAGAIAPNATIEYVTVGEDRNYSVDDAAQYAFENAIAPIVTFGYASCELGYTSVDAMNFSWEGDLAAMEGITFVTAAGDGAAAACDEGADVATYGLSVAMPASVPGALAVGGTTLIALPRSLYFDAEGTALAYIPETGWNDSGASSPIVGGAGGASALYAKPFWQVGVTPNDGARDVPDLALSAGDESMPYVVVTENQQVAYGGTSCGAPSFAGVLAILNQAIGAAQPGLGNVGPVLYALANNAATTGVFHDVTAGSNVVPCQPGTPDCPGSAPYQYGFLATAGYDQVTGNGSVDAFALVQAWRTLAPTGTLLAASAGGTTEGSPLTLSVVISSTGGTAAMTGDVIFYYATPGVLGGLLTSTPLGTVPVTPTTSSGAPAATAQLRTHAPPGLTGTSTIVAFYSGDASYLASWSAGATVVATSSFAISPGTCAVSPLGTVAFTSSSGQAPVTWSLWQDDSGGSIDPISGQYMAGDAGAGADIVVARDAYGAQALATVTVFHAEGGAGPFPPSGPDPSVDASTEGGGGFEPVATADAATGDLPPANAAASVVGEAGARGSGCTASGAAGAPGSLAAAVLAFVLVLGAGGRRVFRDRARSSCRTCGCARRRAPRRGP